MRGQRKRAFGALNPFGLVTAAVLFGLYGHTPDAGAAGGGGSVPDPAAGGGGAGSPKPDPAASGGTGDNQPMPYEESRRLIAERDRAKIANRAITEALGLEVTFEDDPATGKPKAVVKGLDEIKTLRQQATQQTEEQRKKSGKWDEHKQELNRQHEQVVNQLTTTHGKLLSGRDAVINRLAVESPLREALAAEHIVPEAMDDALQLLSGRLKVSIETNEETGEARPLVQPLGEDGKPLLDGKGNPMPIRQFAAEFLAKKAHMRQASFRRGPGAGGFGAGAGGASGGAASATTGGDAAATYLFGIRPAPAR